MADPAVTEPVTDPVVDPPVEPVIDPPVEVPAGAENPDAVANAIKAERNLAKQANAKARELERQLKEELEKNKPLPEQIEALQKENAAANLRAMRIEVAASAKLPLELATRLQGSTEEELKADAASLLTLVGQQTQAGSVIPPDGGYRPQDVEAKKDAAKDHNALLVALLGQKQTQAGGLFEGLEPAPAE